MTNRLDGAVFYKMGVARGRDFLETITIEGVDWSGRTFAGGLANKYGDTALVNFVISTPTYSAVTGNTTFQISITDTVLDSNSIPEPPLTSTTLELVYDLEMEAGGIKTTLLYGGFDIFGRVE